MEAHQRRTAAVSRVVRMVRKVLKERWPTVDLVVEPRTFPAWTRLDAHWTDGPTRLMVTHLVEATIASLDDDPDAPRFEVSTRRAFSEDGIAAALFMAVEQPPAAWLEPNGQVGWVRFPIPEANRLMTELTLPEPPVSAHHLAALVANRVDLSFALAATGRRY